jgi:hypothetical protein
MVVHDHEQEQKWIQKRKNTPSKEKVMGKSPRRISVVAVQCLACTIVVLIALLFRVAGGPAYSKLQRGFADALAGNELMAVLMRLWDEPPAPEDILPEMEGVNGEAFTSSTA